MPIPINSTYSPWMVSAIEATKGDIHICHPFSRVPLLSWSLSQGGFDYDQFQSTELAVASHLAYLNEEERDHRIFDKVLVSSFKSLPSVDDCMLLALHDGGRLGGYLSFNNNQDEEDGDELELPWIEVKRGSICRFDDIIMCKGMILVVDRQGKVYKINGNNLVVVSTFVDRPISQARTRAKGCRRRFVVSSSSKLYLVERTLQRSFKVYKLCKEKSGNLWVEVKAFGDEVLFVSKDYCFFTSATNFSTCNLNNCIVFSNEAFQKYARNGWELPDPRNSGSDIAVFRLGGSSEYNFKPISSFTGFPVLLWSCPPWAWNVGSSDSSPFQLHREAEEDEGMQTGANSQDDASSASAQERTSDLSPCQSDRDIEDEEMANSQDDAFLASFEVDLGSEELILPSTSAKQERVTSAERPPSFVQQRAEQTAEMPQTSAAEMVSSLPNLGNEQSIEKASASAIQMSVTRTPTTIEVEHATGEASHPETLTEEINNQSVSRNISSITQTKKSDDSTIQFEGFEIKSNLHPILENIWSKHGNLMENSIIRNGDIVARALESLATVVVILQENSARSLSDSQADYMSSTLSDLECVHFKVDWLASDVEKAVRLHKSKPLIESLNKLRSCQARIVEQKSKVLDELAEVEIMEKELEADAANLSKLIPFSGNVDLDLPLGGELP